MIRQAAILLGVPVLLAVLVAVPLSQWLGPHQWLCAGVALGLTVPVGLLTLIAAHRFGNASPYGKIAAMFVGTFARLFFGFGGAVVVFFAAGQTFRAEPVSFLGWVLGAYLTTLSVEIALLGSGQAKSKPETGKSVGEE
ncbi:MAG: hypothetical protein U0792_24525 [Gemmataceae bacterium]